MIEQFFNQIKHCRRIATRYDKIADNYLAFVELASIRLWLRVYEFTTSVLFSLFVSPPALGATLTVALERVQH